MSKTSIELANELLGVRPSGGSSAVEGLMGGCHHYGGGMDSIKDFYGKNKTPVMVVGGVVGAALIGWAGYVIYKKYIWKRPDYIPNNAAREDQQ